MKIFIRYIMIVFLILLTAAGLVVLFQSPLNDPGRIGLSELVGKINAGEVKEIAVKGDNLDIVLTDDPDASVGAGKTLVSQKESGVSAFETLLNLGAKPDKLSGIDIKIEDAESGTAMIFAALIPVVLPII